MIYHFVQATRARFTSDAVLQKGEWVVKITVFSLVGNVLIAIISSVRSTSFMVPAPVVLVVDLAQKYYLITDLNGVREGLRT